MRINSIDSYNNHYKNKNSFGAVIYKPTVKIPSNQKAAFQKVEQELKNTNYWDLVVDSDISGNLSYYFQNKRVPDEIYTGTCESELSSGRTYDKLYDLYMYLNWGILLDGWKEPLNRCLRLRFLGKGTDAKAILDSAPKDNPLEYAKSIVRVLDSAWAIETDTSGYYDQSEHYIYPD